MANETLDYDYWEVPDDPGECDAAYDAELFSLLLVLLGIASIPFVILFFLFLFFENRKNPNPVNIFFMYVMPFIPIYIFYKAWRAKNDYKKVSPRLEKGKLIKELIGFDFGQNFKLRETSSNKYREYLIDLDKENVQPLKEFCDNQNEGEYDRNNNETNADIFKEIRKIKSQDGCILYTQINHYHAEKRSCEIDFKNNTIKYIIRWY